MKFLSAILLALTLVSSPLALTGCDKKVDETTKTSVDANGNSKTETKSVTVDANGNSTVKEEKHVNNPNP